MITAFSYELTNVAFEKTHHLSDRTSHYHISYACSSESFPKSNGMRTIDGRGKCTCAIAHVLFNPNEMVTLKWQTFQIFLANSMKLTLASQENYLFCTGNAIRMCSNNIYMKFISNLLTNCKVLIEGLICTWSIRSIIQTIFRAFHGL